MYAQTRKKYIDLQFLNANTFKIATQSVLNSENIIVHALSHESIIYVAWDFPLRKFECVFILCWTNSLLCQFHRRVGRRNSNLVKHLCSQTQTPLLNWLTNFDISTGHWVESKNLNQDKNWRLMVNSTSAVGKWSKTSGVPRSSALEFYPQSSHTGKYSLVSNTSNATLRCMRLSGVAG